jgi:nickel-dependent lactate racemase
MRITIGYGRERQEYEVAEEKLLGAPRAHAADLSDRAAAVRTALETPFHFPALRRALTPDDHVAVVVDENLSYLPDALIPVLEHMAQAGVAPENMTLVSAPTTSGQPWIDALPDAFEEVHVEVHDPADRKRLSYLATMRSGHRLYLNRTVVDADQLVVVSGCGYDPQLGRGGAEGTIYPALSDTATIEAMQSRMTLAAPAAEPSATRREAVETAWLLGAPFFVQLIEGAGGEWSSVVAGATEASEEAGRLLDARWRLSVPRPAELVVVTMTGDPARHTFADWAAALFCASRIVEPNGRIVLLAQGRPAFGPATELLLNTDEPEDVVKLLRRQPTLEMRPALQWATAASAARLYVLSALPDETVEELFATPLQRAGQVQRLLDSSGSYLFVEDAHRALAVIEEGATNLYQPGARATGV